MLELFVVEKSIDTIMNVDTIVHAIDCHYCINIFFIYTFWSMVHSNAPSM